MKPLLAHIYEPHRVTYPCYVQPKLNGIRALYQNGCFQSRDQLPFHRPVLEHISSVLVGLFPPETILDGELYVHGWPLQRINGAVTPVRLQPTEDTLKVEYHIFDTVDFTKSFWDRHGVNDSVLYTRTHFVDTHYVKSQEEADTLYAQFVAAGYEGMMYRLGDCPYTKPKQAFYDHPLGAGTFPSRARFLSDKDNRAWHLLKRKDWQDDEFFCVGVAEGEGKYAGMLGAVVCNSASGATFHVGSGLTDSERGHYWTNPPIGKQIKVKYLCLSSDGIPLNPTILAIL